MTRKIANDRFMLLFTSIHIRRLAKGRTTQAQSVPVPLLCYMLKGAGTLRIDQALYRLQPDQLFFVAPGTMLEATSDFEEVEYFLLALEGLALDGQLERSPARIDYDTAYLPLAPGKIDMHHTSPVPEKLFLLHESYRKSSNSGFLLNVRFQELVYFIVAGLNGIDGTAEPDNGIERSIEYIHDRYREKIRLDTLSRIAGFTPTSYSREFKKLKGLSPFEYLNDYRIARAKQMLAERNRSVKDVAASSGFASEFYFSRMFKRETGVPPTLYMKRKHTKVAVASCMRVQDNLHSLGLEAVFATNCHRSKMIGVEEHRHLVAERLEQLRQAEPELILCDHHHLPYVEQLKRIAPTVTFELVADWRAVHARIAEIVGRENEAERNFKRMNVEVEQAGSRIRSRFGQETVTVMKLAHKLIRVQGTIRHPLNLLIYSELGLRPGACVPAYDAIVEFAPDKFPDMGTDHLFIQHSIDPGDDRLFRPIRQAPQWHSTRAVSSGCIYSVPNWVAMSWSPHGRMQIIRELLGDATVFPHE
ncbi:MAG: transcriptional regulator [Paenibacillus sp.]|nr:transcriptional regulator [Paenibacillus sp.]